MMGTPISATGGGREYSSEASADSPSAAAGAAEGDESEREQWGGASESRGGEEEV